MTRKANLRWIMLLAANVLFWCMLSFQQTRGAGTRTTAPSGGSGPSAMQQRAEIIAQLKEIKAEVKALVTLRQNGALPAPEPSQP
ncbi:MAG: hypothetical protein HY288_16175 [Planctomycetia bacterium]|nr:hypothetical protein [Planctomycetia bacterium]